MKMDELTTRVYALVDGDVSSPTASRQPVHADADEAAWPVLKPIEAPLKPVPTFEASILLPEPLQSWVQDEASRMLCPQDFIAAPLMVALGAVIGTKCTIAPKQNDNWQIISNLWGAIVGSPSTKKTPALTKAFFPLDCLSKEEQMRIQNEIQEFEADRIVHESERKGYIHRLEKINKSSPNNLEEIKKIKSLLKQSELSKPKVPKPRRYKTNDATVEKLGDLLQSNPLGMLVMRDELVGLLATWEREDRKSDRAFFLEAWSGMSSFDVDRIGRGTIHIPKLCLSVAGGIQPDKLVRYLEQAEYSLENDGFLQRFQVLVYPDVKAWKYEDREPNASLQKEVIDLVRSLSNFDPIQWGAQTDECSSTPYFRFSEEAQKIFVDWATRLHRDKIPQEEHILLVQHLAKYEKLFGALALILHLVDCAKKRAYGHVGKETAHRAVAWCEYLEAHARRCYGLVVDAGLRSAQTLAAKIKQGKLPNLFTVRDIRRNQWSYLKNDKAIASALDWLEDSAWIRKINKTSNGRPTVTYLLHPHLRRDEPR